ncbi:MAG: hypothetical protein GJU67_04230 [Ferrovum sp.]|jgi:hypothetical protein|nr:hypothetical protein [Ferrovum sp.]
MELESRRLEWERRVSEWKASGLTQKEYCAREGVGFSGLRYWAARLHREGKKLTLVPVRVAGGIAVGVVIRGSRGWECIVPEGMSVQWVADLLRAL